MFLQKSFWSSVKDRFGIRPEEPAEKSRVSFPSKEGQNATSCISLLDLNGALFCLDNFKILFDVDGERKVISPVKVLPPSNRQDLDAYELEDGFAIHYKDHDYFYCAKMEITYVAAFTRIKLKDVRQPVYSITVDNQDQICVNPLSD
jgi:hypothetical protein